MEPSALVLDLVTDQTHNHHSTLLERNLFAIREHLIRLRNHVYVVIALHHAVPSKTWNIARQGARRSVSTAGNSMIALLGRARVRCPAELADTIAGVHPQLAFTGAWQAWLCALISWHNELAGWCQLDGLREVLGEDIGGVVQLNVFALQRLRWSHNEASGLSRAGRVNGWPHGSRRCGGSVCIDIYNQFCCYRLDNCSRDKHSDSGDGSCGSGCIDGLIDRRSRCRGRGSDLGGAFNGVDAQACRIILREFVKATVGRGTLDDDSKAVDNGENSVKVFGTSDEKDSAR